MAMTRRTCLLTGGRAAALALLAPRLAVAGWRPDASAPPAAGAGPDWTRRVRALPGEGSSDLRLVATGDGLVNTPFLDDEDPAARALFDVVRGADIALMNLEISLTRRGWPRRKDVIRADPSIIEQIKSLGIDVVSMGNNHSMDYGPEGLASTLTTLDGAWMKHAGAGPTLKDALKPAVIVARERNVAFLSFVCMLSSTAAMAAGPAAPGVAAIEGHRVTLGDTPKQAETLSLPDAGELQAMRDAVKRARANNDLVVVSFHMHWGKRDVVDAGRRVITHAAVDAGADLVVCHGPHVLNGIERYEGKYIFNSLGNFFFQMPVSYWQLFPALQEVVHNFYGREAHWETVLPRVVFTGRSVSRIDVLPVEIPRSGRRLGCPRFAGDAHGRRILDGLAKMSEPLGVTLTPKEWYAEVTPADGAKTSAAGAGDRQPAVAG